MPTRSPDSPPKRSPLQPGDLHRMASYAELGLAADFLASKASGNRHAGTIALINGIEAGAIDAVSIRQMAATQSVANREADEALMRELMA